MADTDHERVQVESADELRRWLRDHHARKESIWLVTWNKASGRPTVAYDDVVDQCLCYGWIDSAVRKLDGERSMLRLSPRSPTSHWSGTNKRKVARLEKAGLMRAPGRRTVELAKRRGTWTFLDDVERLELPPDLVARLDGTPGARERFERFPDSSKRGILEWIKTARTDATRARRIAETAEKAARNVKANHPKGRDAGPAP